MAGTDIKRILGSFWFGRNSIDAKSGRKISNWCSDLLLILIPHLLLLSIKELEKLKSKRNIAKLTLIDLPNDFIMDVLTRVDVRSLCHLRSVSKAFLNIVDPYTRRILNSATDSGAFEAPQLMLLSRNYLGNFKSLTSWRPLKYNGGYGLTKSKHCITMPSEIFSPSYGYQVDFVYRNLFCVYKTFRTKAPYLLVDPLRGEVLKLPKNDEFPSYYMRWYGMGFDSITGTHKIVCIYQGEQKAYVYTLGSTTSWRELHSSPPGKLSDKNVSAYEDMHWLTNDVGGGNNNYHIVSFDFKKDDFFWTPHPTLEGFGRSFSGMHLLNWRGNLAIVDLSSSRDLYVEVWVLKNYEKKEWVLEYKIDTKMFAARPRNWSYYIVTCGEWEHGIFFTELAHGFHFWDLRYNSMKCIKFQTLLPTICSYDFRRLPELSIISYTRSLISLKDYGGDLVEREACRWPPFEVAKAYIWPID